MNKKLLFGGLLAGLAALIVFLLFLLFQPLTYELVLTRSEALMRAARQVNYSYNVNFLGAQDGEFINLSGKADYNKSRGEVYWVNNLSLVEDTVYDLEPELLVDLMLTNYSSYGSIIGFDEARDCYLLKDEINEYMGREDLVRGFFGAKVMACFSKKTGYPLYYSLAVMGDNNLIINYQLGFKSYTIEHLEPPEGFNESLVNESSV